jgi:5-methylcytosine-specific restriction endonuclease McrA
MKKLCLKCGKKTDGNDYCFQHKPRTQLQRGNKPSLTAKKVVNDGKSIQMKQFFMNFWRTHKPHICENCNKQLGREPLSYMFDHVLEKSKYTELAFEEENIMYLCLECHDLKTRGHLSSIMEERIEYLKNKFNL